MQTKTKITAGESAQKPVESDKEGERGVVCGSSFYVAGLGASAGGLEALRSFFAAIPEKSGVAFVVIQHLAPDHPSQMVELLAAHSRIPVSQIKEGVTIVPDHLYVIPPGKCVKLFGGKLLLDAPEKISPHLPIDHFFRSLAADRKELGIGISLSGTGTDGTLGVRSIKEAGGMVMVQDEASAKFSGMPDSAGASGLADYTLPPAEMACALLKFIQHPLVAHAPGQGLEVGASALEKIFRLVHGQCGIDFADYKQSTVLRRIERRVGIAQLANSEEYLELLQQSPPEVGALGRDLLISVTRFFRDAEAFAALRDEILPTLLEQADERRSLRIWVPGCATGEEAYSLAMMLQDLISAHGENWSLKIFATDADKDSIEYAGRGLYPKSCAADIGRELLERYFLEEESGFRICPKVREHVVFARQDILRDPPFTRVDLISCRNLLIYLGARAQQKVMALFHFALRPAGFLVLGTSESIGDREHAFDTVNAKMRIFRKRDDSSSTIGNTVNGLRPLKRLTLSGGSPPPFPHGLVPDRRRQERIWEVISAGLMAEFATTCVVVNAKHEILHTFGQPQRFLTVHPGKGTLNLLKLVPRPLSLALSRALRQAAKEGGSVRCTGVRYSDAASAATIDLKVESLAKQADDAGVLAVYFQEPREPAGSPGGEFDPSSASIGQIADLEEDLENTRELLEAAADDRKTAHEELQATNEELLAGNEELQSSNEELESVNEELTTLNTEYQQKIAELIVANNDLENFLRTSDVATIFLDDALRLRRFTPAVTREISLQPHDLGRPLTSFAHPLISAIADDLPRVAAGGPAIMKTVETGRGIWHLVRITPYRREGASDRGLVVTILDVSALQPSGSAPGESKLPLP